MEALRRRNENLVRLVSPQFLAEHGGRVAGVRVSVGADGELNSETGRVGLDGVSDVAEAIRLVASRSEAEATGGVAELAATH